MFMITAPYRRCIPVLLAAALANPVFAAEPVLKLTSSCPSGYRTDGTSGYCVPFNPADTRIVVRKLTTSCPSGYFTDGTSGYCRGTDNARAVVPKTGNSCPNGYRTDATSGYCTATR
ncbi:hypothetical protein F2Q65_14880 [Thiohalocapsa marina]|uniref:Chitin-binding type-2 domain-containing protein n=1 Tax=Thiohalocapsa marina TaxID=424902 RepID=A0A5M8FKL1_9GAMM|nr:hypothetical protein [Thiohalocapsa marina]KAA6183721.1 hypothetical protein F2Q65_14880 [Thiohalocapsa marina]